VHLSIDVPPSIGPSVRVSHLRVDESHGNAHTVWLAQGMPAKPSSAQLRALQQAMNPELLEPEETIAVSASGSVPLDFELPRFGVSLVTLRPNDGSSAGGGGKAATADGGAAASDRQDEGCACRLGSGGRAARSSIVLGISSMVLLALARRKRAFDRKTRAKG